MANQLYTGQSNKIFPYNYMENIKDKETNKSLLEVLSGFNSYFLAYTGDAESTRLSVPKLVRHEGLFISYIDYNNNHITEYYRGSDINDKEWQKSSNWRLGNNTFMGELSISSNGTWVINNEDTGIPARGETGTTPLMRFGDNNKFQVSYNNGDAWEDISNEITSQLKISKYIGVNESLPTANIKEGTIYMKGPYYKDGDTLQEYPSYRMWIYAWKDNTLAWQDNGEFTSITAGIVQETGNSENVVMSQKAVSERFAGMPSHDNDYSNEQWPWVAGSVSPDGKIRTYSGGENWMRTDYLRVDGINSIHAHVYFVNKYIAPIAFYDTNKNFISSHLVPAVDSNEAIESIDVPANAQYVVFTSQQSRVSEFRFNYGLSVAVLANRNSNISNQRAIETNRKDINAQNVLLEDTRMQLQNSTTITDAPIQLTDGDVLERMQAYAYADQGVFIKNQYLDERHWFSMLKLTKGRYQIETKYVMESRVLIAGTISSESQFSIGGSIDKVIVGGGTAGDVATFEIAEDTLLVLLGKEGNAFAYANVAEIPFVSVKDKVIQIDEVLRKNSFNSEVLCCPDTYYAVVGHEFNLYYDGLIKAMDAGLKSPLGIYIDVQCPDLQNASTVIGVRRERMWQIDGSRLSDSYVGEHELYIAAYDENGKMLSRKECTLIVSKESQLQTEKRILCIGDSLTNNGDVVATCAKRFKDVGGVQPIFIGQRTTSGYKHEGYPGYTFNTFVTSGSANAYFIFDIPEGTPVSVGDKYSTNSSTYTVADIRTEGQDNSIRLRCTRSGSTTPSNTGTLSKVSGASTSPSSISYSAFEAESGNPFWDSSTNSVNFTKYRERMGIVEKFDAVIIMLGTNDCIGDVIDVSGSVVKAKTLINAILSDAGTYPTKIILQMTPADANTISSWQVYSDKSYSRKIGYWSNMWNLRKLMYEEFTKDEWKGKVFLGQAALGVDRYYGYPYTEVESSQRISAVKEIYHTNSVHPNMYGYAQLGDGYYLQLKGLL